MSTSNGIKAAVVVVALGVAGFMTWRYISRGPDGSVDVRELKTTFECSDCQDVFDKTQRELQALGDLGSTPPCPKCGKTHTTEVFRCPTCGKGVPPAGHGSPPPKCPFCKGKM